MAPCHQGRIILVVSLCFFTIFFGTVELYILPVITSVEKDFGLPSYKAGMLLSIKEACIVSVGALANHFLGKTHRPRVLAGCGILASLGGLFYALAYFIFKTVPRHINQNITNPVNSQLEMCSPVINATNSPLLNVSGLNGPKAELTQVSVSDAYFMLAAGSALIGFGQCTIAPLSITYIDDVAPKEKSGLYLGNIIHCRFIIHFVLNCVH